MKSVSKYTLPKRGSQDQLVHEAMEISWRRGLPREGYSPASATVSAQNALRKRAEELQGHANQACPRTIREDRADPPIKIQIWKS